jgi:hypothetical protein
MKAYKDYRGNVTRNLHFETRWSGQLLAPAALTKKPVADTHWKKGGRAL